MRPILAVSLLCPRVSPPSFSETQHTLLASALCLACIMRRSAALHRREVFYLMRMPVVTVSYMG